jgi:putative PEP-CTERM system TPR-repeat lipoprotein
MRATIVKGELFMTEPKWDDAARAWRIFTGPALVIAVALCWVSNGPNDRQYSEGDRYRRPLRGLIEAYAGIRKEAVDLFGSRRARGPVALERSRAKDSTAAVSYRRWAGKGDKFCAATNDLDRYASRYIKATIGSLQTNVSDVPRHDGVPSGPVDTIAAIIIETVPRKPTNEQRQAGVTEVMSDLTRMDFDNALAAATRLTEASPNDPAGYNLQGAAYLGKKDYARARKSFEKALSLQPDNMEALLYLAQLDVQQDAVANAQKRYQSMLARDPKNVEAMMGMAQIEARAGNEKAQLAWLEKAKAARPEAPAPRVLLGAYYLRAKNNQKALAELTDAMQFAASNPDVLDMLGQAQVANGQKSQAVATYQQLVSARQASPLAYYRLATAQVNVGDFPGATDSLRRALQLKPDYLEAAFLLAGVEVQNGRHAEAVKLAQQLQTSMPTSPAGFVMEGDVLAAQERYTDAAKAYERAFALQQTGLLAVKLHAAQIKAGDTNQADAKLNQWLKLHPDDIGVRQYLAGENLRRGQNKAAIEQYQLILKNDPSNLVALNNLANLYQAGKDARASDVAERAYKLMPDSAMIADTLGWILVERGKTERGLELLRVAATKDPQNPEVRYHLAVALAKSGDKVKARKELETLLAGDQKFPQREAAQALLKQI